MRKILFLDVDGVLNRRGTKERVLDCGAPMIGVDRVLADRLKIWLAANPDVEIVLSSTWRMFSDMKAGLARAGFEWVDQTPVMCGTRGLEINAFLEKVGEKPRYAILDDNSDMLPEQMAHFVQTYTNEGLQEHHLKQLDCIFAPVAE